MIPTQQAHYLSSQICRYQSFCLQNCRGCNHIACFQHSFFCCYWPSPGHILQQDLVFSVRLLFKKLPLKSGLSMKVSSIKILLPSQGVFHQKLFFIKHRLPSKVNYHQKSSSILGCPPSKIIFNWWSSSMECCLPYAGCLPMKFVLRQRSVYCFL